jgi:hypothetical protein
MYLPVARAASSLDEDESITSTANLYPFVLFKFAIVPATRIEAVWR